MVIVMVVCQPPLHNHRRNQVQMKLDTNSLAHTKWECKYHIVFAPKYRRQIIYGKIKMDIGQMLRKLCEYKGIEIIEAEACKDHIHMLISIPPKYSVAQIMGYLKGKSSLMIFEKHANLKEPLNKSSAALSGSFAPTYRFENLEIHKVFLQFPNLNLEQNPSLTTLAI